MKLKPYYLGLVIIILLGLTASSAFGVGSPGTLTGGTFPACVDPANNPNTSVKIGGKVVAPGGLVRVPVGTTTCLASETTLNLNSYVKTILVSPGPSNIASGFNLLNAMFAATSGTLVKVEPGTYDLGINSLIMKQDVDLEGSGQGLTKITSQVGTTFVPPNTGTVILASSSEIRFLTIENTGTSTSNIAIYANGVDKTAKLTNVTINGAGTGLINYGIYNGNASSPTIQNSTIFANATNNKTNYGIYNADSSAPTILNSAISVSGGNFNYGMRNTNSSSPIIQNSTFTTSGGNDSNNYGIYNEINSSPTIQYSTITLTGNGTNNGLYSSKNSSSLVQNSTIRISGSGTNVGSNNYNQSSPTIQSSIISISGSGTNYGLANNVSSAPTIQNSTISFNNIGTNLSLYNLGNSSTKVGASQLGAGVSGSAMGFTCINSYDNNFGALSSTCGPTA